MVMGITGLDTEVLTHSISPLSRELGAYVLAVGLQLRLLYVQTCRQTCPVGVPAGESRSHGERNPKASTGSCGSATKTSAERIEPRKSAGATLTGRVLAPVVRALPTRGGV